MIKKGDGLESRFRELGFSVVPHPCLPVHRTGTARTKNPNYVADDSWRLFRSAVDVKQFRDDIRVIVSGGDKILHGSLDAVAMCTEGRSSTRWARVRASRASSFVHGERNTHLQASQRTLLL